jgi:pimeloyl-ACP methyl ester carboxylesterase
MIPGTNGKATNFASFDSTFAAMGYYVITPDYINTVLTTVCSKSEDSTCFNNFRQEIMFGTPVSDKVDVDSVNSLENRIATLLNYLAKQEGSKGWNRFVKNGQPRWDRIIVAGHSQGAGHAAYLGKHFKTAGVLLFSGPQDFLQHFNAPASWQFEAGKTAPRRYQAFLHLQDPFVYDYQIKDVAALNHHAVTDTALVQPHAPVRSIKPVFVTDVDWKDKHGSTVNTAFVEVWKIMIARATAK